MTHESHSVEETQTIAADFARTLPPGSTLALHGQLGAGKTQFVRGLLIGLGGNPRTVSSPTYVLLNMYLTGRLPLYHLDAYRITTPADFEALGFAELLDQNAVVAVEWPSKIEELLPKNTIQIRLEPLNPSTRRITIENP